MRWSLLCLFFTYYAMAQNDVCIDATPIECGTIIFDSTTSATPNIEATDCTTSVNTPGLWYVIEGDNQNVSFSTCDQATYDTIISLFEGSCDELNCLGFNDQNYECGDINTSEISHHLEEGSTYYIYVHGFNGAVGQFELSTTCIAPENDLCTDAIPVSCGQTFTSSTELATNTDIIPTGCSTSSSTPGIWYVIEGNNQNVEISTCDQANFDTVISLYEGNCDELSCVTFDDQNFDCTDINTSAITEFLESGKTYYIFVHGFNSATGDFDLSITCLPPENDNCINAIPITCGELYSGSTIYSFNDGVDIDCTNSPATSGVWYSIEGNNKEVSFSTCDQANFDTIISVFEGDCDELSCVDFNDQALDCDNTNTSEIELFLNAGTTYYVFVSGWNGDVGNYDLFVSCKAPVPLYVNAKVLLLGSKEFNNPSMHDDLRVEEMIPLEEPYSGMSNFTHYGSGGGEITTWEVLGVEGPDAIVDWVFLELRNEDDPSEVIATRSALVQRDGDIVDVDGTSNVIFEDVLEDNYYVAIRHRNHLGIMTAETIPIFPFSPLIDFTVIDTWGENATRLTLEGNTLWSGNANGDSQVIFQGVNNELNNIFFEVLNAPDNTDQLANYVVNGYSNNDLDMNGETIYQGVGNDVNLLFFQILAYPANIDGLANFVINEQLP